MSNEKTELYDRETAISGQVVGIEKTPYKKDPSKQRAEILIQCETGWGDRQETSTFPVTIFDKQLTDPAFVLQVGDTVDCVARVTAREYNGKYYTGLTYKSATVTNRPGIADNEHPLNEAVEPAAAGPSEDSALPF